MNFDGKRRYGHRLIVHDLRSSTERVIDKGLNHRIQVGDVTGRWLVWNRYTKDGGWQVFRYNIHTRTKVRVPYTNGTGNYGSTVTPEGIVYFSAARTEPKEWESFHTFCGEPKLVRWKLGEFDVVHRFGRGLDAEATFEEGRSGVHFLIARYRCPRNEQESWRSDIYAAHP